MRFNLRLLGAIAALSGAIIAGCSASEPAVSDPSATESPTPEETVEVLADYPGDRTFMEPNVQFSVATESGTCPETIGLWEFGLGFEGGADHTVVVDTQAVANQPAELVRSESQRVTYKAPLKPEYANCVGMAQSEYLSMYTVSFGGGEVQFDLDLTNRDGFLEIRYADISAHRPYVHWRAAE